jgi:hypothetical protein
LIHLAPKSIKRGFIHTATFPSATVRRSARTRQDFLKRLDPKLCGLLRPVPPDLKKKRYNSKVKNGIDKNPQTHLNSKLQGTRMIQGG